ncbi:MAG: chorismate mutase [Erysipelotrichaceae bacterium]|jgi:monofunctional chorismate mutase|nr:chorismate mutase [Erysipelotrichaceae bacterium]
MATRLDLDRLAIDEIDARLAELFEKRFEVVRDIIDYKVENRLPILDSSREKQIIETNVSRIQDDDIRVYFRKLYADMLDLSREFQDDILREK